MMGFTSNETNTGSATGDKFDKQGGPNFGQRLLQYGEQRSPLMQMVFGHGGDKPIAHNDMGMADATQVQQLPDGSQNLQQPDMSKPAHGLNLSAIAKLLMGA